MPATHHRPPAFPWLALSLNLLPLLGVLMLGWDLFTVMLLYWFEAAMLLIFGMARVLWFGEQPLRHGLVMLLYSPVYLGPAAMGVVMYCLATITFFYAPEPLTQWEQYPSWQELVELARREWLWVPMLTMVAGYGGEFIREWVGSGAYRRTSLVRVMGVLYGRLILFQVLTIAVAGLVVETGMGVLAVLLLVAVKTAADLGLHAWRRHTATGMPERGYSV